MGMVDKFRQRLLQRGYVPSVIDAAVAQVSYADRHKYLQRRNQAGPSMDTSCLPLVVPHVSGVPDMRLQQMLHSLYDSSSEAVRTRISKPFVSFTKGKNLGAFLVRAGA